MGRRNTAKTGDKKLYKNRDLIDSNPVDNDTDAMYTSVDRFHNEREQDFLRLEGSADDASAEEEGVMNLGGAIDDDDESSSSDDESIEKKTEDDDDSSDDSHNSSSSSSSEEDDDEERNVRDWGTTKTSYYNGDTADLEIGQETTDAEMEETAANEIVTARYTNMVEDDFYISDDESHDGKSKVTIPGQASAATKKQRQRALNRQHPELLPLLSHFTATLSDLHNHTLVATSAVMDGEKGTAESIGTTKLGQEYLVTKSLLQSSTCLNFVLYMLLKLDEVAASATSSSVQNHPIMAQLQTMNSRIQKLYTGVEENGTIAKQLSDLVKAAKLLKEGGVDISSDEDESMQEDLDDIVLSASHDATERSAVRREEDESSSNDEAEIAIRKQSALTEARFGLRANEVAASNCAPSRRRRRMVNLDAGDDDDNQEQSQQVSESIARTLNTIEQRTAAQSKRRTKHLVGADTLDEPIENDGELAQALRMMEEDVGPMDENDKKSMDPELEDDDDDNKFYNEVAGRSHERKQQRQDKYAVQPKFPRVAKEIVGERAINKVILKNRGLVAHKARINRNPRVKKREQFRKALIRRKGAVQELRNDVSHTGYGGEETGIKTTVSKSRKLAR